MAIIHNDKETISVFFFLFRAQLIINDEEDPTCLNPSPTEKTPKIPKNHHF